MMLDPCTIRQPPVSHRPPSSSSSPSSFSLTSSSSLIVIQVRAFILAHGRALDDDGFKFVLRYYVRRVQTLVASLGKKSSVWQEAFDKYVAV